MDDPTNTNDDAGAACALPDRASHWYETTYEVPSEFWGAHTRHAYVYARDDEHARALCAARGLGEQVTSGPFLPRPGADYFHFIPLSALLPDPTIGPARKLHAFCWLAFLACRCGAGSADLFFGDAGLLHEWAHLEEGVLPGYRAGEPEGVKLRAYILERVREVESRVPGIGCAGARG